MDKKNQKERQTGKRTAELRLRMEKLEREIAERKQAESMLRESQRVSSTLISNLPGMVYRCLNDRNWTVTYISEGCVALTGYQPRDFTENRITYGRLICPDDQGSVWTMVQTALREKKPFTLTYRINAADGKEKWAWEQGRGVFASNGELLFLEGFVTDITERKLAEEALRESKERFRVLYDDNPSMYFTVDVDGTVLSVNRFGREQLGYRADELVGHSIWTVFHEEDRQKALECVRAAFQAPAQVHQWELRKTRKDGCVLWVREDVRIIQDADGKPLALVVCEDITERKQMEEALRRSENHMALLSRRLLEVQEAERQYVARELHDEIGQCLTGLKLGLETALRLRERESRKVLLQLVEQADSLISKSRELSLDLRPAMLDDMGLLPALLFHFERFTERFGVRMRFEHRGIEGRFHPCLETAVFRIVQETLTNVARHAQVEEAMVTIMADEDGLTVQVKDEGVGFDLDKALASGKAVGLSGIHERAILLGGQCDIESAPGTGAQVRVRFPFSEVVKREAASRAEREEHD